MKKIIYLDGASTTRVYPEVLKAMIPYFLEKYGNPGSAHALGEEARGALDVAREKLAKEIGAKPWEIVFTSGASESNSLAFLGCVSANSGRKKILISAFEHDSIYETARSLKKFGYEVVEIPVDRDGVINIEKLKEEVNEKTLIVSIIHGHNELGVLQDLSAIAEICRKKGALFHTDAVQSFGKEKINVREMKIDLLSASAHKIGGPKGIGFLYVRDGIKINSIMLGGSQEKEMRAGTENVPGATGFAKALEITKRINKDKIKENRDYFMKRLEEIGGIINCSKEKRLFNNIHVSFPGIDAEKLVVSFSLKGIMCSTRSACSEKMKKENRILEAISLSEKNKRGSLRFTLNEEITKKDVEFVLKELDRF